MLKKQSLCLSILAPFLFHGLILFSSPSLLADSFDSTQSVKKHTVEIAVGHFSLPDLRYREVYQSGGEIFSIEFSRKIFSSGAHHLAACGSGRSFKKNGSSTITHEDTALTLIPLSFGLRYVIHIRPISPRLEFGITQLFFKEKSSIQTTHGHHLGFYLEGGCYFKLPIFPVPQLKFHIRHSHILTRINNIVVNLGGLEIGAGLAFLF